MATDTASADGIHGAPSRRGPDFFQWLTRLAAAASVLVLGWIIWEVFQEAKPALEKFGLGFLTGANWQPNRDRYGVLPFLVGTGATARMQMRRRWADDEPGTDPLLDLTDGAGITLGGALGTVLTEVDATDTEAIPYGLYVAEWELSNGEHWQLEVEVAPEVVRVVVAP
jgi:hypothetical protein